MKILIPSPADLFALKGLKSLNLSYPLPDSKNVSAKMEAAGFNDIGYLSSKENLLYMVEPSWLERD